MVTGVFKWLPIHYAACFCHALTPLLFATLLALTSAVGLRKEDGHGNTLLLFLQYTNESPHKTALAELCEQALADHAAFEARYHPLVSAIALPWCSSVRPILPFVPCVSCL